MDYNILSIDAGLKYKGIFLQTEIYNRWLDNFVADGPLPVASIHDTGFYIQAAFYPVKKKLELYGATSQIFGDKGAGFDNSSEYLVGMNFYPIDSRYVRLNLQLIDVDSSPVSSAFGYYVGGQTARPSRRRFPYSSRSVFHNAVVSAFRRTVGRPGLSRTLHTMAL